MTWTAPMTFTDGNVLTGAQLNTHLRDNLNETAPAKADSSQGIFVSSGTNSVARRSVFRGEILGNETTTATTYGDLATLGPSITVTTGTAALVLVGSSVKNTSASQNSYASYNVSGASSIAATDSRAVFQTTGTAGEAFRATLAYLEDGLTAGSNTFRMKYRVTGGTGDFGNRHLVVIPTS